MKQIIGHEQALGNDGGKAQAQLGIDGGDIVARVEVRHPVAPIVDRLTVEADKFIDKVENAIPGDWDKPLLEKLKVEYKEAITKAITGA